MTNAKLKLVVITGAGMSAESGMSTFRDGDGLWNNHRIEDVATPEGWERDPERVLDFYNDLRSKLARCEPNAGHRELADMERDFDVWIVTQNVDDLHERAGSSRVLHLHGELTKACDASKKTVEEIGYREIRPGDRIGGDQARPFIVWFGEAVPAMEEATKIVRSADAVAVIGSSLQVYPAAGLVDFAPKNAPIFLIDPQQVSTRRAVCHIQKKAGEGVAELREKLRRI